MDTIKIGHTELMLHRDGKRQKELNKNWTRDRKYEGTMCLKLTKQMPQHSNVHYATDDY